MRIQLHTPFGNTLRGNGVTADRWAAILRELGHTLVETDPDVLVALHARHSHDAIVGYKERFPERPLVLALTGTDVYRDIHSDERAQHSARLADRYVVLQPHALGELSPRDRKRAHVIYQSAVAPPEPPPRPTDIFQVCVVGHLREVKDPFRAAEALRLLPDDSRVRLVHLGAALDEQMGRHAEEEMYACARYRWLGERSHAETLHVIASSHVLVLSSLMEGGANVLTEAIACGTPALISRIGAAFGILGEEYPGLFDVGDTQALATLLARASQEPTFHQELTARCSDKQPLVDPASERESWAALLRSLTTTGL